MKTCLIFLSGLLFGAGLVLSGMTDPSRVIGFLDFFGSWDPALAFVMGGAVLTFAAGLMLMRKAGKRPGVLELPDTSADPISRRRAIGSMVFGAGWGLGGFCPGPALANLSVLRADALWFVPAMLLGMFVAQRIFDLDQ